MALFKDMLKSSETLFKNPVALDYEFMPKLIPYRENEQFQIASCLKPLMAERNGRNMIITGTPGIGKTIACKNVLQELEDETEIIPLYVNCWHRNTSFKVALELCDILGYKFTHNKRTEELFSEIKKIVNKKAAVFVFDEADKLEDYDILYWILEDVYKKSIILITNHKSLVADIDSRVKSRMMPEIMEFKPYNRQATEGILKHRVEYAFFPNVLEEDAFKKIVDATYERRDMRIGLYLLRESGNIAEDSSSKKITVEHSEKAILKASDFTEKKDTELDSDEKQILELIKENKEARIGDLFKTYEEKGGKMQYKSFQRKIKKLEEANFVSVKKQIGGKEGSTSIITFGKEKKLTDFE